MQVREISSMEVQRGERTNGVSDAPKSFTTGRKLNTEVMSKITEEPGFYPENIELLRTHKRVYEVVAYNFPKNRMLVMDIKYSCSSKKMKELFNCEEIDENIMRITMREQNE